jgi:hypothetical protein
MTAMKPALSEEEKLARKRAQTRERVRRHRATKPKRPRNILHVQIQSLGDAADLLVETGDLPEWDAEDPDKVAKALAAMLVRLRRDLGVE